MNTIPKPMTDQEIEQVAGRHPLYLARQLTVGQLATRT
jgi:hypothetical protein